MYVFLVANTGAKTERMMHVTLRVYYSAMTSLFSIKLNALESQDARLSFAIIKSKISQVVEEI